MMLAESTPVGHITVMFDITPSLYYKLVMVDRKYVTHFCPAVCLPYCNSAFINRR